MRGDAERRALMRGPITLDHLIAADTPSGKSSYAEKALSALSPRFHGMYSAGRPSIPPEHLVKGSALIALYSIRSERQFCERIYDLLQVVRGPEHHGAGLRRLQLPQEQRAAAGA